MIEILSYILSAICISASIMYIYYNKKEKNYKIDYKMWIAYFIAVIVFTVTYKYVPPYFKQIAIMFLLFFMSKFGYSNSVKKSIIDAAYLEFVCITAELLYTIIFVAVSQNNLMEWNHSVIGSIITNSVIPLIMVLLDKFILYKKIYSALGKFTDYLSKKRTIFSILFFFILVNILFYAIYYAYYTNKVLVFIAFTSMFLIYTIILFSILYTSNSNEMLKSKYSLSVENLKSYESMLDQYRISNHENKNQLLLIRNMVKDSKTRNYIDELINNKEKDDSNVYNKLKRIPESSIRAVIYSKILLMNNKKISYSINIDRKLTSKVFINVSSNLSLDICNILNIFIDNAIDEVSKCSNKQILIEFNKNNDDIEITISNTCKDDLKLDEIYGIGYSTKGENHGYGLAIVKNIIDSSSSKLINKTEKVKNIFTQYLYIRTK